MKEKILSVVYLRDIRDAEDMDGVPLHFSKICSLPLSFATMDHG